MVYNWIEIRILEQQDPSTTISCKVLKGPTFSDSPARHHSGWNTRVSAKLQCGIRAFGEFLLEFPTAHSVVKRRRRVFW
eukprot:1454457-Rhodomonas_salina.1